MKNIFMHKEVFFIAAAVLALSLISPFSVSAVAGTYSISLTSQQVGPFSVTLSGTAEGDIVGKCADQHVAVLSWDAAHGLLATPEEVTYSGRTCSDSTNIFKTNWTASHTYAAVGAYTVKVRVYHAKEGGAEGSEVATIDVPVVIPPATLTVIKNVDNAGGGTKTASDFTLQVTGTNVSPASFSGSSIGTTVSLDAGTYSVSEPDALGYTVSYSADCTGSIASKESKTCTVTNTYLHVNNAPALSGIGNKTVNEGDTLSFTVSASDPDGDTLTYSASGLPSGATFDTATRTFSWTPDYTQAGSYPGVRFEVSDGTLTDSEEITITVEDVNRAPVISAIADQGVDEGALLTVNVTASEPDGSAVTYSLGGEPSGMTIGASSGVVTWTPTEGQGPGVYNVTVIASDGVLSSSTNMKVTVAEVNVAPVSFSDTVSTHINTSKEISLSGSDTDLPAQSLTFSIVSGPANGSLGPVSGNKVTYTPNAGFSGSDSFTFKLSDGVADSNVSTVTVDVNDHAPILLPISDVTAPEGAIVDVTPSASDPDGDVLTYSIVNAPAGSSFNTATGVLTWGTGENDGPSTTSGIIITVSDGVLSDSQTFSITINEVNTAPVVSDVAKSTNEDTPVTIDLNATDSDVPVQTLTYKIVTPPVHGSLVLTSSSVVYTPTADYFGTDSFEYTANDGVTDGNTATVSITINPVNDAPVISVNPPNPMNLLVGTPFVDPGITIADVDNATSTIATTTVGTVDTGTVGSYTITYTATDAGGLSATATRTVVVSAAPDTTPPTITLNGSNPLSINVGEVYNEPGAVFSDPDDAASTLATSTAGAVNTAVAGTYTVTYTATDPAGNTTSATRTVNVVAPVVPPPNPPTPPGGGGGGGGGVGNGSPFPLGYVGPIQGGGGILAGEVLGASTTAQIESCVKNSPYLLNYIKLGAKNDAGDVARLQVFLNEEMGINLPITGFYGQATLAAVNAFQVKYIDQILQPWFAAGLAKDNAPSGYVYKTTKRWINILKCRDLEPITPMPQLP